MARKRLDLKKIGITGGFLLLCAVFVGVALLPFLPASSSEIGQTMPDGTVVRFLPGGSSEWWVQVQVLGSGGQQASGVDGRATNGTWAALERQNWTLDGSWWAKSFHVPPGSEVQFRISTSKVSDFESCWFTHPDGLERCA